jgi:2-polyprenyl-3-methyl-5-hydroxy-6-metoxy-1,4-benzoquinol methylase
MTEPFRPLTRGEAQSLSRYYLAYQRYEAMRELLRYEDSKLIGELSPSGKRMLELGCGSLPLLLAISERDLSYIGTDLSENGVRLAKRLAPHGRFLVSDAGAPGLSSGQFDIVVMKNLLHHVERPADCLRAVKPLLAPGGEVVVLEPNSRCLAATLLKKVGFARRMLENSPYGQLNVERLRGAFTAAGFEVTRVRHSGVLAFPLSGDYGGLKVLPMGRRLWRAIIACDRLLSMALLGPGRLAPWLGFKVIFHMRSRSD